MARLLVAGSVAVAVYFGVRSGVGGCEDEVSEQAIAEGTQRRLREEGVSERSSDRVSRAMGAAMSAVFADPEVKQALMRRAEHRDPQDVGFELAAQGIARLDPAQLDQWNGLRLKLAEVSPSVCAAFWNGAFDQREMYEALGRLSDRTLRQWASLSAEAMKQEVRAARPVRIDSRAASRGFDLLLQRMPPRDREVLQRASRAPQPLPEEQACEAMKLLLQHTPNVPDRVRDDLLRSMSRGFQGI